MERKWIIVAFGDITGFSAWRRRASTQPEIAQPFLKKFYEEIEKFSLKNKDLHLKYLGDGFMMLKELNEKYNKHRCVVKFVQEAGALNARLLKIVHSCEWPPPDGFRTRIVCGHVDKLEVTDPINRKTKVSEYVGYAINLAQKLLQISPETHFVCHESVIKVIGRLPKKFKTKKMKILEEKRKGVDPEDIANLWEVEFF